MAIMTDNTARPHTLAALWSSCLLLLLLLSASDSSLTWASLHPRPPSAFLLFNAPWPFRFGPFKAFHGGLSSHQSVRPAPPPSWSGPPSLSKASYPLMATSHPGMMVEEEAAVEKVSTEELEEGGVATDVTAALGMEKEEVQEEAIGEGDEGDSSGLDGGGEQEGMRFADALKEAEQAEPRPPSKMEPTRSKARRNPKSLALWELFRELDRRGVVYDVLESRQVLEFKLASAMNEAVQGRRGAEASLRKYREQARGMSIRKLREVLGKNGVNMTVLALEKRVALEKRFVDMMYAYHHKGEQFLRDTPDVPSSVVEEVEETPSPITPERSADGIFSSVEEAEVWASMLSMQELQVELDFLAVPYSRTSASRGQLARLLAQAIMNGGVYGTSVDSVVLPSPLLTNRRRATKKSPPSYRPSERRSLRSSSLSMYGEEEEFMDVDKAREELRAIFQSMSKEEQESARARLARQRNMEFDDFDEEEEEDDEDEEYSSVLADGAGDMADRAWGAVQQVRERAVDLVAATLSPSATKGRKRRPRSQVPARAPPAPARPRARVRRVASRGVTRLSMVAMRSSLNSLIQGLVGAARWSGSGLLPARYVLFFIGVLCLILRQGVTMFVAALFILRALTGTLQGILGGEEDPEPQQEKGPDLLDLVFS